MTVVRKFRAMKKARAAKIHQFATGRYYQLQIIKRYGLLYEYHAILKRIHSQLNLSKVLNPKNAGASQQEKETVIEELEEHPLHSIINENALFNLKYQS